MSSSQESLDRCGMAGLTPKSMGDSGALDRVLSAVERREIINALRKTGGRRNLAARLLGISRSRLYRRMETLKIGFHEPPHGHA
jgi:DNA-binding NtrC family response regulator